MLSGKFKEGKTTTENGLIDVTISDINSQTFAQYCEFMYCNSVLLKTDHEVFDLLSTCSTVY